MKHKDVIHINFTRLFCVEPYLWQGKYSNMQEVFICPARLLVVKARSVFVNGFLSNIQIYAHGDRVPKCKWICKCISKCICKCIHKCSGKCIPKCNGKCNCVCRVIFKYAQGVRPLYKRGGERRTIVIVNVSKTLIVNVFVNLFVNVFVFIKMFLSNIQICAKCAAHDKVPKCKSDT